jgi:hypothetical protein
MNTAKNAKCPLICINSQGWCHLFEAPLVPPFLVLWTGCPGSQQCFDSREEHTLAGTDGDECSDRQDHGRKGDPGYADPVSEPFCD